MGNQPSAMLSRAAAIAATVAVVAIVPVMFAGIVAAGIATGMATTTTPGIAVGLLVLSMGLYLLVQLNARGVIGKKKAKPAGMTEREMT